MKDAVEGTMLTRQRLHPGCRLIGIVQRCGNAGMPLARKVRSQPGQPLLIAAGANNGGALFRQPQRRGTPDPG